MVNPKRFIIFIWMEVLPLKEKEAERTDPPSIIPSALSLSSYQLIQILLYFICLMRVSKMEDNMTLISAVGMGKFLTILIYEAPVLGLSYGL